MRDEQTHRFTIRFCEYVKKFSSENANLTWNKHLNSESYRRYKEVEDRRVQSEIDLIYSMYRVAV